MATSAESQTLVERAMLVYERQLRETLEKEHRDEFVAIEPESGDYFLGLTLSEAIQAARRAHPDRLPFAMRVGHRSAVHIGTGDG